MKKRLLSLVLALALTAAISACAAGDSSAKDDVAKESAPKITWLTASADPDQLTIYHIPELELFSLGDGETVAMADAQTGRAVTSEDYDWVYPFSEGLAPVVKVDADGAKWGYIDATGAVVVPLEYDVAGVFSDGLAGVGKADADGNTKYGYIDATGAVVIPLEYDGAGDFSEGLARVGKADADGNLKCGYIDATGAVVIPLEYDGIAPFMEGLALARKMDADGNTKYGYIDATGAVVLPVEYDDCGYVYEDADKTVYGRFFYVVKGVSIGVFENPYYEGE